MDRKSIISAAIVLWLIAVACGTSGGGVAVTPGAAAPVAATAAPAATGPAKVGDRVIAGDTALTVVKTERKSELSQFQKAKDGMTFVIVEVLIENAGTAKGTYNLLYFKARDAEGFEYNPALGVDQPLQAGELDTGGKARGNVAFEVKAEAKGLVVEYKPLTIGAASAIRIALE